MSEKDVIICPNCGEKIKVYRNPFPTVDIIIEYSSGIVLVSRKNAPYGWALPGGFVDYGESLDHAARREAYEETSLSIHDLQMFHVYSDPDRDPRFHTITTVFVARGEGVLRANDDAVDAVVVDPDHLPDPVVFDHAKIIDDYRTWKKRFSGGIVIP
ncbi:MAG TPA: NUDIX hydrolase [Deltaproteobacteria bacterium]|nr:NUDIX hydrolase [Deltaproteobacteria bacterium]